MGPMSALRPALLAVVFMAAVLIIVLVPAGLRLPAAHAQTAQTSATPGTTVAVLYFDYDGTAEDMGFLRKGLNQMLVTDLVGTPGITVVERVRLEEVLSELELNRKNKIDRTSAVRVGKLLGARYLVMGSYFDFKDTLHVAITVVDVETGAVVGGVRDHKAISEFWSLEQLLAARLGTVLRDKAVAAVPPATERAPGPVPRKRSPKPAKPRARPSSRPPSPAPGDATAATAAAKTPQAAVKKPISMHARIAARYGRGLDAMDRGDKQTARTELEAVLEEQPDFSAASVDLARLAL